MSLAKHYNREFKRQLRHFAAWQPLTAGYEVGDYGRFSGGVFTKLGNVREFGIDLEVQCSQNSADFSFSSSGARIVRSVGGTKVDAFPGTEISGELEVSFEDRYGFMVIAHQLAASELESADQVAFRLANTKDELGRKWDSRWRIVKTVYVATNPTIIGASERSTRFKLSGTAAALRRLELGETSVGISVGADKSSELKIIGEGQGPIALDLFRVKLSGRAGLGGLSFSPPTDGGDEGDEVQGAEVEYDDDWPADIEDDDFD